MDKLQRVMSYAVSNNISYEIAAKELGMILSPEEQLALQNLGGDPGEAMDVFERQKTVDTSSKKEETVVAPKKKNHTLLALGIAGGIIATAGLISGVFTIPTIAGLVGGGAAGAAGAGATGLLGGAAAKWGLAALGTFILVGCSYDVAQNTKVEITEKNKDEEILAAIKEMNFNFTQALNYLMELLGDNFARIEKILLDNGNTAKEILDSIKDQGDKLDARLTAIAKGNEEIKALLVEIVGALNEGKQIGVNNNLLLTEILKKLSNLNGNDKEIIDILKTMLGKITDSIKQEQDMDEKTHQFLQTIIDNFQNYSKENKLSLKELMERLDQYDANRKAEIATVINAINKLGANGNAYLEKILNGVLNGNEIELHNLEVLKVISDKIDNLNLNPTDNQESIKLLKEILEKIVELTAQEKNMTLDTQALIKDFMNKFDTFDINTQKAFAIIIEKMDKLGENGKAGLEKILKAINDNTTVAKGTYEVVKALLDKVDKLGGKADMIIDVVSKIGVGEKVDLTKIEAMLAEILAQEKANNKIFNSLNDKLNLVSVTLQGLKVQIDSNNKAVLDKLQAILDKIPNGCKCTTLDITVIIEKLDKIIEEIKKDPKNEGILGDLGNLDNLLG